MEDLGGYLIRKNLLTYYFIRTPKKTGLHSYLNSLLRRRRRLPIKTWLVLVLTWQEVGPKVLLQNQVKAGGLLGEKRTQN